VLVSAGIGVTPMVSMLQQLCAAGANQPILFVHGARDSAHHPLSAEVRRIAADYRNVTLDVCYSRPAANDVQGKDYDRAGRVNAQDIADRLESLDADFYLCGPASFMSDLSDALIRLGVPERCVHTESFGPSAQCALSKGGTRS
jgi:ferredoxin-NADP reductase